MNHELHYVRGGGSPDLNFHGQKLGSVSSFRDGYTRWTELAIYKTSNGEHVGQVIGVSTVAGETNRYTSKRGDLDQVMGLFKKSGELTWLAKELVKEADLPVQLAIEI